MCPFGRVPIALVSDDGDNMEDSDVPRTASVSKRYGYWVYLQHNRFEYSFSMVLLLDSGNLKC